MQDRTHDGSAFRILNMIDEYSRECLCVKVGRSLRVEDVLEALTGLFCRYGTPEYIRSDNGQSLQHERYEVGLSGLEYKRCT